MEFSHNLYFKRIPIFLWKKLETGPMGFEPSTKVEMLPANLPFSLFLVPQKRTEKKEKNGQRKLWLEFK